MVQILNMDAKALADVIPTESVDCVVTSSPYFRKKRYVNPLLPESELELGQEPTRTEFVNSLLDVMDAVKRVLKPTGVVFWNLDDTYAGSGGPGGDYRPGHRYAGQFKSSSPAASKGNGRHKCMMLVPFRFAMGCCERGWILRSIIIWDKGMQFEGGVRDRPHHSWEPIFMFVKQARGYYGKFGQMPDVIHCRPGGDYPGHSAPYPEDLIEPLIRGGCPPGGVVLDPFAGSGTTLVVAERLQRKAIGVEINPEYCELIEKRLGNNQLQLIV